MRFVFDERRAAQAAARLLHRHDGSMPCVKLVKLLYLADREALIETGVPITGDRFISMRHGPVPMRVLSLIKNDDPAPDSIWHGYVERRDFDARLAGPADDECLSKCNRDTLDGIFEVYGCRKEWDVIAHTHALPEWRDPGKGALPIEPEDILWYSGYSEEAIQAIAEQAEAAWSMHHELERLKDTEVQ